MTAVRVEGLRVDLDGQGVDIVDAVDFTIDAGEIVGLVGESGSGKSTVAAALLGDARRGARVVGGRIFVADEQILGLPGDRLRALRGKVVAYVPQDPSMALNPALRLRKQLAELFDFHEPLTPEAERTARISRTLDEVGLPPDGGLLDRYPHQLSGGQQQRVTLAMAFLLRPKVIVLDEPTTGLDVTTQARVIGTIRELCANHQVAALYVTHDMAVVAGLAHRVLVMYGGRIVESAPCRQLFGAAAHPYTRALIAAVPLVSGRHELHAIPGDTPAPGQRPAGCSFHPRCPDAVRECSAQVPAETAVAPDQSARCLRAGEVHDRPMATRVVRTAGGPGNDADTPPILTVTDLVAAHGRTRVLHGVSLDLYPHECVAVVGESGCGKTTMSRSIIGLHHQYQGAIAFRGQLLRPRSRDRSVDQRRAIQYIFQSPYNSLNPRRSIGDILREPLALLFHVRGSAARSTVADALERVSLSPATAAMYPSQLSGGERQRVAIARALVCRPDVLICDEVTSALDVSVQASIVRLLRRLQREEGLALLFVTHNLALVRTIADRIIAMRSGRLVEAGNVDDVLDRPADAYTRTLIAATPTLSR